MPNRRDFGSGSAFDRDDWNRHEWNRSGGNRPSWDDRDDDRYYRRGPTDYDPRDYHARVNHPSDYDRHRDAYEREREMSRRHYGDRPGRYSADGREHDYRARHYGRDDRYGYESSYFGPSRGYDTSERYRDRDREPRSSGATHNTVYDRWGAEPRAYRDRGDRTDMFDRGTREPEYFGRESYRRDFRRYREDRNENRPDNDFDRFRGRGLW